MPETNQRHIGPSDLLQHMQVPDEPGLYVLGCFERRVTLLSQQVRALNLVYTLCERDFLQPGSKVCVIGGGVAGITLAAAAATKGCDVILLEKKSKELHLFRGNHSRWLHPHIYDWPEEQSGRLKGVEPDDARLPLLPWTAAPAGKVAHQLMQAWEAVPARQRIRVIPNVTSVDLGARQGQRRYMSWNAPGFEPGEFDVVVLAVGFGQEQTVEGIDWPSYWDDDRLHQEVRDGRSRHLISGCGDGGLVDVLRVRLHDFQHEHVVSDFLSSPSLTEVKQELLRIEQDAYAALSPKNEAASRALLMSRYRNLQVPDDFEAAFKNRLRKDTSAVLNGLDESPLSLHANILNRFLVSRLIVNGLEYRPGSFHHSKLPAGAYAVRFASGPTEPFHRIICRHGPAPSAIEEGFPDIWKKCEPLRSRNALEQTRWPLWPEGYFGPESGPSNAASSPLPQAVVGAVAKPVLTASPAGVMPSPHAQEAVAPVAKRPHGVNRAVWFGADRRLYHRDPSDGSKEQEAEVESTSGAYMRIVPSGWVVEKPDASALRRLSGALGFGPLGTWDYGTGGLNTDGELFRPLGIKGEDAVWRIGTATQWFEDTGEVWGFDASALWKTDEGISLKYIYLARCWSSFLSRSLATLQHLGARGPIMVEAGVVGLMKKVRWAGQLQRDKVLALREAAPVEEQLEEWTEAEQLRFVTKAFNEVARAFGIKKVSESDLQKML